MSVPSTDYDSLSSSGFVDIGTIGEYTGRAKRVIVSKRDVAIWVYNDEVYAVDANCYHAAGALEQHVEDIEDVNGEPCIRCPEHKYIISLKTGESFYETVKIHRDSKRRVIKVEKLGWRSKGVMQRTHTAKVINGRVYIKLNDSSCELESDKYAYTNKKGNTYNVFG